MKKRFVFRLEFGITLFLFLIIISTALIIFVPWYYTSKKNVENIVTQINNEIMAGISGEIGTIFDSTTRTLLNINELFKNRVVSIDDKKAREAFFLTILKNNPSYSWIVFGWPNGDFLGAQREILEGKEYFSIVNRKWEGDVKLATKMVDLLDNETGAWSTRTVENENFNSTKRSWYTVAVDKRGYAWTSVYPFATTRTPGLNVSIAYDDKTRFVGVLSIAMELNNLCTYLSKIKVGKTGIAFIMNANGELVAFKDPEEVVFQITGQTTVLLRKIEDANNPEIRVASNLLKSGNNKVGGLPQGNRILYFDRGTGRNYYVTFSPLSNVDWTVCTVIPEEDFLSDIYRNIKWLLVIIGLFFLLNSVMAIVMSKKVLVDPIVQIADETRDIKDFNLGNVRQLHTHIREINLLSDSMFQMSKGLSTFQKYLPTELVRNLVQQGKEIQLGGSEERITIFFSDIVSFTEVFEQLGNRMIPYLGEYIGDLSRIITDSGGTIDKYIGDSIMAFWGAPIRNERHASHACKAAVNCQRSLHASRIGWEREGKPKFFTRMGINTGTVLVGNIGSEQRFNYTVIGETVNLASRLESLNKQYGTSIMIGRETYEDAKQDIVARKVDTVRAYGSRLPLEVYELVTMKEYVSVTDRLEWIEVYEMGLERYCEGSFAEAIALLQKVDALKGGSDRPSQVLAERCRRMMTSAADSSWDGVTDMGTK